MPIDATCRRLPDVCLAAAVFALLGTGGCAALRGELPGAASAEACRKFSREGVSALETGELGRAEQLLRQAVKASPADADSRGRLAEALWARGERREAAAHMASAARLEPDNAGAAVRCGQMLLALGRRDKALDEARRSLTLQPDSAAAWALRGRCHRDRGDTDRALADLQQSLQHQPDQRDVLADIAWLYRSSGRRRRELTTLHSLRGTYVPGEEPTELIVGEAEAYLALGRPRPAVERLRLACGRTQPSAELLYRLAEAEAAAGDTGQAMLTAQRAVSTDASHAPARELVARLGAGGGTLR